MSKNIEAKRIFFGGGIKGGYPKFVSIVTDSLIITKNAETMENLCSKRIFVFIKGKSKALPSSHSLNYFFFLSIFDKNHTT